MDKHGIFVLQNKNGFYFAEIWNHNELIEKTRPQMSKENAIRLANRRLPQINTLNGFHIPPYGTQMAKPETQAQALRNKPPVIREFPPSPGVVIKPKVESKPLKATPELEEIKSSIEVKVNKNNTPEQEVKPESVVIKAPKKPRPAGTPYGLKGFFIDKNGNVKLMLDRRCNAKSITLEPTFLAQISGLATNILQG